MISAAEVRIDSVKIAENLRGIVLRCHEAFGGATTVVITQRIVPANKQRDVYICDLLERRREEACQGQLQYDKKKGEITVHVHAFQVISIMIELL